MGSRSQAPPSSANDLVADMLSNTKALSTITFDDPMARMKLMAATRSFISALETPGETLFRFGLQPFQTAVIGVAVQMNLFTIMAEGENNGRTAAELAKITGGEELLIVRIMRALTALGIFKETGERTYAATPLSLLVVGDDIRDEMQIAFDNIPIDLANLPKFLASTGFTSPTDPKAGPLQYAYNMKHDFFEWLEEDPKRNAAFNRVMTRKRTGRVRWYHIYSLDERLVKGLDYSPDSVLLVDVGGGKGHDAQALRAEFPSMRGRLIVQDLPHVIDEVGCKPLGIEAMPHSFFDQQPVKGARAYYMSSVLHDWPDEACRDILRNVVAAMKPGYSRLLLNEAVVPSVGAPLPAAMLDIAMMMGPCGMERTHSQWHDLLSSVGLEISHIASAQVAPESIIEAVLKE